LFTDYDLSVKVKEEKEIKAMDWMEKFFSWDKTNKPPDEEHRIAEPDTIKQEKIPEGEILKTSDTAVIKEEKQLIKEEKQNLPEIKMFSNSVKDLFKGASESSQQQKVQKIKPEEEKKPAKKEPKTSQVEAKKTEEPVKPVEEPKKKIEPVKPLLADLISQSKDEKPNIHSKWDSLT